MSRWKSKVFLNPAWPHILGLSAIVLSVAVGLFRFFILDWADPIHCGALLNKGSWLDRRKFTWQPDGCMLNDYKSPDTRDCFHSGQLLFIGDSTTRQLFYQTAHILDKDLPTAPKKGGPKHLDVKLTTSYGSEVKFIWDPFLNSSYVYKLTDGELGASSRPALLVIGTGLWYLQHGDTSGGLAAWEANIERILNNIAKNRLKIADSIVVLPVKQVVTVKLSQERAGMRPSDIDAMNSDLLHRINPPTIGYFPAVATQRPAIPVAFPRVFSEMLDASMTEDGVHYADPMIRVQANILLNMRCNDILPKSFPFSKTCCFRYPTPSWIHTIVLLAALLWGVHTCIRSSSTISEQGFAAWLGREEAAPIILSIALLLAYSADRSGLWLKEQKHFDPWTFGFLSFASLLIGLVTVSRSDNDLGLLNRDQTDEWKGWMQIAILIYHYLGASKISGIYNPIRVLVAGYLFMTGYGHTTYYLRKADFGLRRAAQILIRLNLLTLLLAYIMNTDYLSYYFAPLVSLWYTVIYATMAVAPRYNELTFFVFWKIVISGVLFTVFMGERRILEFLFWLLERFCNIHWSAREWAFRVTLDQWIVYAGMLFALAQDRFRSSRFSDDRRWPLVAKLSIVASAMALIWFFIFELGQESKFTYNKWHPSISFIPIISFVILRNATVVLRSAHSRAFAFVGRCSLETFILQYHIWLAGDTKGILLIIPGTEWRPINFLLTSVIFIYLSNRVAHATNFLTTQLCGSKSQTLPSSLPNVNRSDPQSGPTSQAEHGLEQPEPMEELHPSPDGPSTSSRTIPPLQVHSRLQEAYLSAQGKLLLIVLLMWMLNIMWPRI